jgi:hypothetical protein
MSIEIRELNIKTELTIGNKKENEKDVTWEVERKIILKLLNDFETIKRRQVHLLYDR